MATLEAACTAAWEVCIEVLSTIQSIKGVLLTAASATFFNAHARQ